MDMVPGDAVSSTILLAAAAAVQVRSRLLQATSMCSRCLIGMMYLSLLLDTWLEKLPVCRPSSLWAFRDCVSSSCCHHSAQCFGPCVCHLSDAVESQRFGQLQDGVQPLAPPILHVGTSAGPAPLVSGRFYQEVCFDSVFEAVQHPCFLYYSRHPGKHRSAAVSTWLHMDASV